MRPIVFAIRVSIGAACFAAAAGCSDKATPVGDDAVGGAGGALAGEVSCADDPRVDVYSEGMERPGSEGVLTFALAASRPAPPAKGSNTFDVRVVDGDGAPRSGDLTIDLFMPDHGHGTKVTPVVKFDADSGSYTIAPVYLFMPGVWRVTLDYYSDSATDSTALDHAEFFFCVEG